MNCKASSKTRGFFVLKNLISRFSYFFYGLHCDTLLATFSLLLWYANQTKSHIHFSVYFLLLSTTWIIYCIDHLLDSKFFDDFQKIPNRYLFVSKNKPTILIFIVIIILINFYIIFDKLAFYQILFGIILCLISAVYIYINHKIKSIFFPKELIISLVFLAAILIASNLVFYKIALVVLFGLIFSNVLLYSLIGESEDKTVKMTSSVHYFGEKKTRLFLLFVLIANALLIISYDLKNQAILFVLVFYFLIVLLRLYKTKSNFLRNFCDVFLVVLVL